MFKKALAHQSNATPLRSSARRQLVASVFAEYPVLRDSIAAEGSDDTEGKLSEKDLGRLLVPEGVRTTTFETSGGVGGVLYISPDGEPVWMSFDKGSKHLIPTLSLLASLPSSVQPLPILELPYPLPPPLLSGAALFLGAVRNLNKPWRLPTVPEGSMVALVAPVEPNKPGYVAYVGVGHVVSRGGLAGALERRVKCMNEGVDHDDGKFCDTMCIIDDHLWDMGSKPTINSFPLPQPREPLAPPPEGEAAPAAVATATPATEEAQPDPQETSTTPLTPAEVSTLLTASLYQTLTTISPSILPLPASQLYSAHILPSRPAYIPPARREDVVIARSEWKKLAKWMKDAAKDGVIKIKESKAEVTVTGFDPSHPLLQAHAPFKTIGEEETRAAKRAAREAAESEPTGKQMDIQEMWKPSGTSVAFWEACGIEKSSLNPGGLIKSAFDTYVTKHNLVDKKDHRLVVMDKVLASAVGGKEGALNRDEITRRLRASVAWNVVIGGVVKKGTLNPITMVVKTRQGRKQVTLISGLEGFGIDIDEFAEELRKVCAGATSIQPLTGASPKLNLKEVLVQGSQCKLVTEALVSRGVPKRWIKEEGGKKK